MKEGDLSSSKGQGDIMMETVNTNLMAQKTDKKSQRILVIGMAYCCQLVKQFNVDPEILNICQYVGSNKK